MVPGAVEAEEGKGGLRLRFLDEALQPAGAGPAPFPSALIEYMPRPPAGAWITQYGTLTSDGKAVQIVDRRMRCGSCGSVGCHS